MPNNSATVKHYKNIADSYDSRFQKYIDITAKKVVALADVPPGGKILDLGCGTGEALLQLGQKYPDIGLLAGIDASEEMLRLAKTKLKSFKSVDLQVGTIERLPYADDQFDLIVSVGVLHYVHDIKSMTEEVLRVLKPHGRIMFIDMANESITTKVISLSRRVTDPGAVQYYSLQSASELLRSHGIKIQSAELFKAGIYGLFLIQGSKS